MILIYYAKIVIVPTYVPVYINFYIKLLQN